MSTSTVTSKGQITIPVDVRRKLRLTPGTRVEFVETDEGAFRLVPATTSIRDLKGVLSRTGQAVLIEAMDEGIAASVGDRARP